MTSILSGEKIPLLCSILFYVLLCPYTKVEESFNMQASHDLLFLENNHLFPMWSLQSPTSLSSFDHLEFPGVVPRTFLGAISLILVSWPCHLAVKVLHAMQIVPDIQILYLYLVRSALGVCSWLSFTTFSDSVAYRFGFGAGRMTCILTTFQFHLPFYMSRTLPNSFALIGCLLAYSRWIRGKGVEALLVITFCMIVFRCDLLLLLAPLTLQQLLSREAPLILTAVLGISTALVSLLLTVSVDSFFWQRLLWPEGVVLFFNTVANRSSEWGVLSWHWYFSNALPKSLHISLPLAVCAVIGLRCPMQLLHTTRSPSNSISSDKIAVSATISDGEKEAEKEEEVLEGTTIRRLALLNCFGPPDLVVLYYCLPAISYTAIYSILPHKELRFLFPVMPLLVMAAGVGFNRLLPLEDHYIPFSETSSFDRDLYDASRSRSCGASGYSCVSSSVPTTHTDDVKVATADATVTSSSSTTGENEHVANKGVKKRNTVSPSTDDVADSRQSSSSDRSHSDSRHIKKHSVAEHVVFRSCILLVLLFSAAISCLLALAASHNYPGGVALNTLLTTHIPDDHMHLSAHCNSVVRAEGTLTETGTRTGVSTGKSSSARARYQSVCPAAVKVHIDAAAAMTGITRFCQEPVVRVKGMAVRVVYSKAEGLTDFFEFDWLLTEDPWSHGKKEHFDIIEEVSAFQSYTFMSAYSSLTALKTAAEAAVGGGGGGGDDNVQVKSTGGSVVQVTVSDGERKEQGEQVGGGEDMGGEVIKEVGGEVIKEVGGEHQKRGSQEKKRNSHLEINQNTHSERSVPLNTNTHTDTDTQLIPRGITVTPVMTHLPLGIVTQTAIYILRKRTSP